MSTTKQLFSRMRAAQAGRLAVALPLIGMTVPMIMLYMVFPSSFEFTWKGRAYYVFFLWLVLMETILGPRQPRNRVEGSAKARKALLLLFMVLPTAYVMSETGLDLNGIIVDSAETWGVYHSDKMPLSMEYLVMAACFFFQVVLLHGVEGLSQYSVSASFLGLIAMIYSIDNIYPYGRFTPFQVFVPTTTFLASILLNALGYSTTHLGTSMDNMPLLMAERDGRSVVFSIAWPCSGVESLIIYMVTIMVYLKKSDIKMKERIIYFLAGAVITYLVNILRIATIFMVAIDQGMVEASVFHNSLGQMYSLLWIVLYMLAIPVTRYLWRTMKSARTQSHSQ